uniref:Replication factor A C-terminal domain-containing protein n=1 Tax=Lactuca sativa TaxID=4236 RepID=A0A9R1VMK4_LACSA|nr:hypothetical protein LSAT_V11C500246420 [Lactuca sativa]
MQVALCDVFALKLNSYISEHQNENALVIILLRSIADIDLNVKSFINTIQLNTETVVAKPKDYYIRFQIKNIDDIPDYNEEGWYSFYCRDCSKKVTKNGDDSDGEPFNCNGCGGVSDVFSKVNVVIRVQDETRYAFIHLFRTILMIHLDAINDYMLELMKDEG